MKTTWIIIGAAGDLAQRKIIPAFRAGAAGDDYTLIAVDRHVQVMFPRERIACDVAWR